MLKRLSQNAKIFMLITGCIILSLAGFHLLIVKQEQVLRKYFIDTPRERLKESNKSWADSVGKSFVRENRTATLSQLTEYVRWYGRTDRF
jgi:hypothetical protein